MSHHEIPQDVTQEFKYVDLGDPRLNRRCRRTVTRIAAAPTAPFPVCFQSSAELKGFYRLMNHPELNAHDFFLPHRDQTVERIAAHERVLIMHDTTSFTFNGTREDLGRLVKTGQGFWAHFSLAVSPHGERLPLGVLNVVPWTRAFSPDETPSLWPFEKKEQERWAQACRASREALLGLDVQLVHIMDREGDDFQILSIFQELPGDEFIIRLKVDREIETLIGQDGEVRRVRNVLAREKARFDRTVTLSRRLQKDGRASPFPSRQERQAKLSFAATEVILRPPNSPAYRDAIPLKVGVVRVWEESPPDDAEPIEWLLITSLPIDTIEEIVEIVDSYRARWLIEELNKAIKTGCQFEKRRGESLASLLNVLMLLLPIAWQLLHLRACAHLAPETPAREVVNDVQHQILVAHGMKKSARAAGVLLAIAQLGGYQKRRRGPGWIVLSRGMRRLQELEHGWRLAMEMMRGAEKEQPP